MSAAIAIDPIGERPQDVRDWSAYVERHADATVYHRLAWRRIFGEGLGYRSWMLLARDVGSGAVAGLLPLYLVRAPWGRKLVAVPFRDRGGPIGDSPQAIRALLDHACRVAREQRATSIRLKSTVGYPAALVPDFAERRYWIRSRVDLRGRDAGGLLAALGQKTRNMVRQGEKQGLSAQLGAPAPADYEAWYELHLRTQRKLGVPPFPARFFREMFDALGAEGALRVCFVRSAARAVSACVLLVHRDEAIYGYSASDPAAQSLRPGDFMMFHAMKWLLEQGYAGFDLGSDAPSQESLLFFKKKWLAAQAPIPDYTWGGQDHGSTDSSSARYRALRAAVRVLPLAVLRALGSRVVRFFG